MPCNTAFVLWENVEIVSPITYAWPGVDTASGYMVLYGSSGTSKSFCRVCCKIDAVHLSVSTMNDRIYRGDGFFAEIALGCDPDS